MTSRNTGNDGGGLMVPSLGALVVGALLIFAVKKFGLHLVLIVVPSALALFFAARWAWIPSRCLPRHRARYMRIRLHLWLHPGHGHATVGELWLRWSRFAVFRHGKRIRPGMKLWQRILAPSSAYSLTIGRAHYRHRLAVPLDEHVIVKSPPRSGKTGWLAGVILRYPGSVVATSTKADLFDLTAQVRQQAGPVEVFNPQQVGDVASTFSWNPLEDCAYPAVAIRRADSFVSAVNTGNIEDASFWQGKASSIMRGLFCAASLAGGDMRLVARWAAGGAEQAEDILAQAGHHQWAAELAELRGAAQKTAATIAMVVSRALAFLADPALAAAVLPAEGGRRFDIETFLRRGGTLYLIADSRSDESPVAPLFATLAGEIHHTAALLGSRMRSGRLDPPLLLALDEVTQICPVPLPSWLADSGGRGIQIITIAHGEAQLRSRWQANGARVILDTSGVKVWLPGISDPEVLEAASKLCGTTAMLERGQDQPGRHPVMTAEMIRQLPPGRALVLRGALSPVIAKLPMGWKDRSYKRARRSGFAIATLAAAQGREAPVMAAGPTPAETAPADASEITSWPAHPPADVPAEAFPWSRK